MGEKALRDRCAVVSKRSGTPEVMEREEILSIWRRIRTGAQAFFQVVRSDAVVHRAEMTEGMGICIFWGELKFPAPQCKEFRNLRTGFTCYFACLPRNKLRGIHVQSFSP
jgi:hypothetical protein